jgi:hypothetical protein
LVRFLSVAAAASAVHFELISNAIVANAFSRWSPSMRQVVEYVVVPVEYLLRAIGFRWSDKIPVLSSLAYGAATGAIFVLLRARACRDR